MAMSTEKETVLDLAARYVCPGRVETFRMIGVPVVMGRREGHYFWDLDGRRLFDAHINGGTFSLGHRNPEIVAALQEAIAQYDIGNHHFPSGPRARLAEALAAVSPEGLRYSVFASSGSEANDIAIKSARHTTRRRKIVSLIGSYHGHTGLCLAAGDVKNAQFFLSDGPAAEFIQVPFNDLDAMRAALAGGDAAAVILEPIPATLGFPLPNPGYLLGVKKLCEQSGALLIADEVQTGLGRTGAMWGVQHYDVEPDIIVTGKGLSGGMYPIAAAILNERAAGWLTENGWGHVSTFGGAEVGCHVGLKVMEILRRPGVLDNVAAMSEVLGAGLDAIRARHPFLVEIRRNGLVMGLRFDHEHAGPMMTAAGYEVGLWAFFAGFDRSVLQFKPGMLITRAECAELLDLLERAIVLCESRLGRTTHARA
ncbi:MAG TPA: aminotransferase class III-fold pyridoxal phosphate-dependent enzyme [Candidatus Binatia bacterium]|nr:aminotransferase class III-fold pyridoxal phosphate-dependent enzyme [Candidatus Binatia bacterium]